MSKEQVDVYILKSKNHFFLTSIWKDEERNGRMECSIQCKTIPYEKKDEHDDSGYKPYLDIEDCLTLRFYIDVETGRSVDNTSYLAYIESMDNCSMDGKMKRGSGMRELVASNLALCSDIFHVEQYSLLDLSTIKCGKLDIFLMDYGMLVQGKTWYQRAFNAVPLKDEQQEILDEYPIKLAQIFSYEDSEYIKDIMRKTKIPINDQERYSRILTDSAEEGQTWQYTLSSIDSNKTGCSFFEGEVSTGILKRLDLGRVSNYKILYDDFIKNSLVGYTKIE